MSDESTIEKCWCGRPLHYSHDKEQQEVEEIIDRFGEYISIQVDTGKTYRVHRHYIALHGIKGKDLGSLGFQEVDNEMA